MVRSGPGHRLEEKLKTLGLDPTQQEKIQAILDAAKPQREQIRTQIRAAFDGMHTLLDQETPTGGGARAGRHDRPAHDRGAQGDAHDPARGARRADPDQSRELKAEMMPARAAGVTTRAVDRARAEPPPEPPPED